MVRSEENRPERATLRIDMRRPVPASSIHAADLRLAVNIGLEVGQQHVGIPVQQPVDDGAELLGSPREKKPSRMRSMTARSSGLLSYSAPGR